MYVYYVYVDVNVWSTTWCLLQDVCVYYEVVAECACGLSHIVEGSIGFWVEAVFEDPGASTPQTCKKNLGFTIHMPFFFFGSTRSYQVYIIYCHCSYIYIYPPRRPRSASRGSFFRRRAKFFLEKDGTSYGEI